MTLVALSTLVTGGTFSKLSVDGLVGLNFWHNSPYSRLKSIKMSALHSLQE